MGQSRGPHNGPILASFVQAMNVTTPPFGRGEVD